MMKSPALRLKITGMHCGSCVQRVRDSLRAVEGVQSAEVTLDPPAATVQGDLNLDQCVAAVVAAGDYTAIDITQELAVDGSHSAAAAAPPGKWQTYFPLILIIGFLVLGCSLLAIRRGPSAGNWRWWMTDFMGGYFLVFAFFKLLNLAGFARAYRSYDLLAERWPAYGWAYPFIELALGVAYVLRWQLSIVNVFTLLLMLVGTVGVVNALRKRQAIQCACLGTVFNLPMSTVTIIENMGMAAMALAMIFAAGA